MPRSNGIRASTATPDRKPPKGGSGTATPKQAHVSMDEIKGRRIVSAEIQPNPLHPNTQMSLWLLLDDGSGLEATAIFGPHVEEGQLAALSLRHHKADGTRCPQCGERPLVDGPFGYLCCSHGHGWRRQASAELAAQDCRREVREDDGEMQ